MGTRNTEKEEAAKAKDKRTRIVTSQKEFKNIEVVNKIIKQEKGLQEHKNSIPCTKTTIQLRNGTIKETWGERYNNGI